MSLSGIPKERVVESRKGKEIYPSISELALLFADSKVVHVCDWSLPTLRLLTLR